MGRKNNKKKKSQNPGKQPVAKEEDSDDEAPASAPEIETTAPVDEALPSVEETIAPAEEEDVKEASVPSAEPTEEPTEEAPVTPDSHDEARVDGAAAEEAPSEEATVEKIEIEESAKDEIITSTIEDAVVSPSEEEITAPVDEGVKEDPAEQESTSAVQAEEPTEEPKEEPTEQSTEEPTEDTTEEAQVSGDSDDEVPASAPETIAPVDEAAGEVETIAPVDEAAGESTSEEETAAPAEEDVKDAPSEQESTSAEPAEEPTEEPTEEAPVTPDSHDEAPVDEGAAEEAPSVEETTTTVEEVEIEESIKEIITSTIEDAVVSVEEDVDIPPIEIEEDPIAIPAKEEAGEDPKEQDISNDQPVDLKDIDSDGEETVRESSSKENKLESVSLESISVDLKPEIQPAVSFDFQDSVEAESFDLQNDSVNEKGEKLIDTSTLKGKVSDYNLKKFEMTLSREDVILKTDSIKSMIPKMPKRTKKMVEKPPKELSGSGKPAVGTPTTPTSRKNYRNSIIDQCFLELTPDHLVKFGEQSEVFKKAMSLKSTSTIKFEKIEEDAEFISISQKMKKVRQGDGDDSAPKTATQEPATLGKGDGSEEPFRYRSYKELVTKTLFKDYFGVDKFSMESYLTDEEFMDVFDVEREDFEKLPKWKCDKMKKEFYLY